MKGKKVFSSIVLILTLLISIYFIAFGVFMLMAQMNMAIGNQIADMLYGSFKETIGLFSSFCIVNLGLPGGSKIIEYVINFAIPVLYLFTLVFALILLIKVLKNKACKKLAIFTLILSILTFAVGAFYFLGSYIFSSNSPLLNLGQLIFKQYAVLVVLVFAILTMFCGIILINYEGAVKAKVQAGQNGATAEQNANAEKSYINSFENQNNMNVQNGAQPTVQNNQVPSAGTWQNMGGSTVAPSPNPTSAPIQAENPWDSQPTENAWGVSSTPFEATNSGSSYVASSNINFDTQPGTYSSNFSQGFQVPPIQAQPSFTQPSASTFPTADISATGQSSTSTFPAVDTPAAAQPSASTFPAVDTPATVQPSGSTFPTADTPATAQPAGSAFGADVPASSVAGEYLSSTDFVKVENGQTATTPVGVNNGQTASMPDNGLNKTQANNQDNGSNNGV